MYNYAIQWQMSMSIKVLIYFYELTFAVLEILRFEMFDFENLSQGHRAQHSQ